VFVQKFKFILMKMHKNCCHQSCSFWRRYAQNRLSDPTGEAYSAPPDPLAGLGGGASRGKGRREGGGKGGEGGEEEGGKGRGGRKSRNAQIQSWQAYHCHCLIRKKTIINVAMKLYGRV